LSIADPNRASNAAQLRFRSDAEYSKWSSDHSQLRFGTRELQMLAMLVGGHKPDVAQLTLWHSRDKRTGNRTTV
jgi:hypothetical protein